MLCNILSVTEIALLAVSVRLLKKRIFSNCESLIMDSLELLAREDEFKKLNKQLEKKTESLIKQIEQSMVSF